MRTRSENERQFRADYNRGYAACEELMAVLAAQLKEHKRSVPKCGACWPLCGDLGHIQNTLEMLVTGFECRAHEEEAVALERALAKHRKARA